MAFAILATVSGEIAVDIEYTKIHEALIENYNNYQKEPMLQQQILWMLASFLMWPRSSRQVHKSQKCLDFFKFLIEDREKQLKAQEVLQKQKDQDDRKNNSIIVKGGAEKLAFMAKYNKSVQEKIEKAKERDAEIARINFITIPVSIKRFMRETNGEVFKEKKSAAKEQAFKTRKNFDEKPKFGTVDTAIFVKGEAGLLPGPNEDDEGNERRVAPEWEKYLNNKALSQK